MASTPQLPSSPRPAGWRGPWRRSGRGRHGLFGALAGLDGRDRPRLKALGFATPALIVGGGPPLWIWVNGQSLNVPGLLPAVPVFMIIGAALLVVTARTCGRVPCLHALALSAGFGTVALGGLLILQTHGWLYLTF